MEADLLVDVILLVQLIHNFVVMQLQKSTLVNAVQ